MNFKFKNIKFFFKETVKRSLKAAKLIWRSRQIIIFLLKDKGFKASYNFVWVKLFVKEAGPAIMNPLYGLFPFLAPHPTHIEIEATTRCHLKCAICEHRYWTERPLDMSFDDFKHLIGQFPHLKWVGFAGIGSNFLNQHYMEMMRYLKNKNIYVSFVDHFDRINKQIAEQIVEMGVDQIEISMDGATKETYEIIKVGCKFERTLEHIAGMLEAKKELGSPLPQIMFRYIVTKQNIKEAPDFLKIVRRMKDIYPLRDDGYAELEYTGLLAFKENEEYALSHFPQEIKEKILEEADKIGINVSFAHQNPKHKRPRHTCAAWVEPFIFADGEVMACCAQNENNKREVQRQKSLGNIFKTPFKDIWNSNQYKKIRKNVPRSGAPTPPWCKDCRVTDI